MYSWRLFLLLVAAIGSLRAAEPVPAAARPPLRQLRPATDPSRAILRIHTRQRAAHPIPRAITGKFAEHLGFNIYNGMDAQILRNPTFADYPFWTGQMSPDGLTKFHWEDQRIHEELRRLATRFGWPETELDGLVQAHGDGLASFWTRVGPRAAVTVSPDTGPHGGRAQRLQASAAGQGLAQWIWLPLHRQRTFEFEIYARSPDLSSLRISLARGADRLVSCDETLVAGLSETWTRLQGRLTVPDSTDPTVAYRLAILADRPGQFVVRHAFLRPIDHVRGADPDVICFLKDSHLPLLRWPGGNFVSAYHWEDGIGPIERRPTRPNYAWGGVEPNTFGTDEFIAFCRAVGCEPMICVNAGDGTAAEAARWLEYCNGSTATPMGELRAAHGHPDPYGVQHWEIGNELWGRWQFHWTTAAGYVDRYRQFAQALRQVDPTVTLYACGAPVLWGKDWNDTLIAGAGPRLEVTTDHPLIGGTVSPATDPVAVHRDFMAVPEVLEQRWSALRDDLARSGIAQPRLAVTELQTFARLSRAPEPNAPVRLTRDNLPGQASLTEAIYNVLIYHACVRLAPFVTMVTHSATVNHGGGLRKERERVWANPCHYAQAMFAALAEATPVALEIECALEQAPRVLPDLRNAVPNLSFGALDTLAAVAPDGALLLSLVHRGSTGPIRLSIECRDFPAAGMATVRTLTAAVPWATNTLEHPEAVLPSDSSLPVHAGQLTIDLAPYTVARVRLPAP